MDLATIKAQIEKSREFEESYAGAKFRLRLPSEHYWRLITEDHMDSEGRVQNARAARKLLEAALIGWEGLTAEHLLKGAGEQAVPYSSEAISLLLDERGDVVDHLAKLLVRKLGARRAQQEASRKN